MSMTTTGMKQIALDIGLASDPSFANFFSGPNEAAVEHLRLWADNPMRSPVPTYLWPGRLQRLDGCLHAGAA